jgi:hypothetical protein
MDPKVSNKNIWSSYYFSKKPLPNFIIFGLHLNHQILENLTVFKFLEKSSKARGLFAKPPYVFYLKHLRGRA